MIIKVDSRELRNSFATFVGGTRDGHLFQGGDFLSFLAEVARKAGTKYTLWWRLDVRLNWRTARYEKRIRFFCTDKTAPDEKGYLPVDIIENYVKLF